jgi:hypothetical protein
MTRELGLMVDWVKELVFIQVQGWARPGFSQTGAGLA